MKPSPPVPLDRLTERAAGRVDACRLLTAPQFSACERPHHTGVGPAPFPRRKDFLFQGKIDRYEAQSALGHACRGTRVAELMYVLTVAIVEAGAKQQNKIAGEGGPPSNQWTRTG